MIINFFYISLFLFQIKEKILRDKIENGKSQENTYEFKL
jgi:hypothetical protein